MQSCAELLYVSTAMISQHVSGKHTVHIQWTRKCKQGPSACRLTVTAVDMAGNISWTHGSCDE